MCPLVPYTLFWLEPHTFSKENGFHYPACAGQISPKSNHKDQGNYPNC